MTARDAPTQREPPASNPNDLPLPLPRQVTRTDEPPGWEVLAAMPGLKISECSVKAWPNGRLLIRGAPREHAAGG